MPACYYRKLLAMSFQREQAHQAFYAKYVATIILVGFYNAFLEYMSVLFCGWMESRKPIDHTYLRLGPQMSFDPAFFK